MEAWLRTSLSAAERAEVDVCAVARALEAEDFESPDDLLCTATGPNADDLASLGLSQEAVAAVCGAISRGRAAAEPGQRRAGYPQALRGGPPSGAGFCC